MIIYTPLDLPKIEPDDWSIFWGIWNQYSGNLTKVLPNGNHSNSAVGRNDLWQGLDIYKDPKSYNGWQAPFYDVKEKLPKLHNTITSLPISNVRQIRLVSSKSDLNPHSDDVKDMWVARAYFHYTSPKEQWYFTRPGDRDGTRTYITRPSETNWFAYNDKHCWHATEHDHNHPKILLQVFASSLSKELIYQSITKYKDYTITYN